MSRLGATGNHFHQDNWASSSGSSSHGEMLDGDQAYPALDVELLRVKWYHPNLNRNSAEHILIGANKVGSYLLRNFTKGGPDDLTVSVKYPDEVKHFQILWKGDGYLFGKHKFDNLRRLLEHFENIPALGTQDCNNVSGVTQIELRYPYPREVDDDMASYGNIDDHIEARARPVDIHSNSSQEIEDPEFEIRQKTGYLTKRGDNFKTWKNRWFVIQKQWMRYYEKKDSTNPRGVIDFTKALDCNEDDSFSNGFTLTYPKRIYYIQATNPVDRSAWIDMIRWKLEYYNPYRKQVDKPKPLNVDSN